MPLESLHTLVEKLRQRIESHRSVLSGSEWLTRYTLIDPMLRELGWDTEDPDVVTPEYSSGRGRVDYALLTDGGRPALMVEAKPLQNPLLMDVVMQVLNYCWAEGTEHFAVTNGQRWEIYETNKAGSPNDKRVASFDLMSPSVSNVCLQALALWRRNVTSGQVSTAQSPVLDPMPSEPAVVPPSDLPVTPVTTSSPNPNSEGQPLSEFQPEGERGNKSIRIMFPDESSVEVSTWYGIPTEVARWLVNKGVLNTMHCPIKLDSSNLYILHSQPSHPNGSRFVSSEKVGAFYLNTHYSARNHVRNAVFIVDGMGLDPSQFRISVG